MISGDIISIMTAAYPLLARIFEGGHPGAIVSTSAKLGKRSVGRDLLRNDDEFVYDIIPKQLARCRPIDLHDCRILLGSTLVPRLSLLREVSVEIALSSRSMIATTLPTTGASCVAQAATVSVSLGAMTWCNFMSTRKEQ